MPMTVYLAGPMEGIPLEQAKAWRTEATLALNKEGIEVLDPTRRKKFHDEPYSINLARRIVQQDLIDIYRSQVVLLNLKERGEGRAWGSIVEMALAQVNGRVVIAVIEEGFKHPFLDVYCTEQHHTLEDALKAILTYKD